MHSPLPRDKWILGWQGDLLNYSAPPRVNAAKNQATLSLPNRPGTYTLQLLARNTRGEVASSNRMQIIVEECQGGSPRSVEFYDPNGWYNLDPGVLKSCGSASRSDTTEYFNMSLGGPFSEGDLD